MVDKSDMFGLISSFSTLVESGYRAAMKIDAEFDDCGGLTFLGLGGSAIGGDLLNNWIGDKIPGGIRVERGFSISSPIDSDSLVVCSSYSGNTAETLNMLDQVLKSKAKNILLISSGGELEKISKKKSLPLIKLKPGMPPRTTLASIVSSMAVICDELGWTKKAKSEMLAASDSCQSYIRRNLNHRIETKDNVAKQIAHQVHGFIPVVIAPSSMEAVARRWKTQMNENAKQHCFFGSFPEISHNEIVPWQRDARSGMLISVLLKDNQENEELSNRFEKFVST
ncbi:MAG: hypothetical protein OEV21_07495, partial [Thermoplasmata archaeon]|nr:hypothetical protein [Thermoplasmata archaeon]